MHLVVLFEPTLPLPQPLRTRARDRPRFGRALLVEAALGLPQPTAPPLHRRQPGRQLVAAPLAEALVLGPVDRVGLSEDLLGDPVVVEVLMLRGIRIHLRAINRQHRHTDQASVGAEREDVAEQTREPRLVTLTKARDGAVIRPLVRRHHPHRDIIETRPLDHRDDRRPVAYAYSNNATIIAGSRAARPCPSWR